MTPRLGIWCSIHLSYGAVFATERFSTSFHPLDQYCSHGSAASISSMALCRIGSRQRIRGGQRKQLSANASSQAIQKLSTQSGLVTLVLAWPDRCCLGCEPRSALFPPRRFATPMRSALNCSELINAKPFAGSLTLHRCTGDSRTMISSVGLTWASSRWPANAVPTWRVSSRA